MKNKVSIFLICIMLLTYIVDLAPKVSAESSTDMTNVALQAVASTTAGTSQNKIGSVNDGNMTIGWVSNNFTMPAYVTLDWGVNLVTTSKISISANFGPRQGVKTMDLEFFDGQTWQVAKSDITLNWTKNEQAAETLDITFPEIKASKLRIKVKSAAQTWSGYAIMELQVWGKLDYSASSVAGSITSIKQPSRGQLVLELPAVPEGFAVQIHSSDREDILALDGTISPTSSDEKVSVVLEVIKLADQTKANTVALQVLVPGKPPENYTTTLPKEDTTSIIKNPAMGWVLYVEEFGGGGNTMVNMDAQTYWDTVDPHIDAASILYIRVPWSRMEPSEGQYAWNVDENYKKLVKMAQDRNIKLAFRVVIDSQDVHMQATPQFVFDAGARGVPTASNPNFKTPIVTDLIFREKFENFVQAFAEEYDDPSIVDFVDGGGMGYWGEMYTFSHSMTKAEKDDTFKWIVNLYADNFKKVLIGQQDASSFDWALQDWAYEEKGFILRRDSYGSPVYFDQTQKDRIVARFPAVPVFAENCYQNFVSRASSCDGQNKPIRNMLTRVVNDALYTHANTLDLRHPEDVIEFSVNHPELVEKFALQGGYRFVLNEAVYPATMKPDTPYKIYHSWKNTGVGKLPNDLPNWGHKYKVAFALLDPETQQPVSMSFDKAEPADWIKGQDYSYTGDFEISDVPDGTYDLAVAIVDTTNNNKPAIKLAVEDRMTSTGWYTLGEVKTSSASLPAETKSTLSTASSTVQSGKEFNVNFGMRDVTQHVYALDTSMDYDANLVEFVSAESAREGVNLVELVNNTPGKLRFIMASTGAANAITSDVQLLNLVFKAKTVEQPVETILSVTDMTMGDDTGAETKGAPSSINMQIKPETVPPVNSGDVNNDGKVSIGDLALVAANYGKTSESVDWEQVKHMDLDKDGKIDILDLSFVARKIVGE